MHFNTRQLVTMAVFGALWGFLEISLGSLFHAIHLPLTGTFLAAAGITVALSGRLFVPVKGSTLFIGVIAMVLKLFSLGSIVLSPMIAIFAEALVAELVLSAFRSPGKAAFLIAGAASNLWPFLHPFITNPLLFGRGIFVVWLDTLDQGARLFHLNDNAWIWILSGLVVVHLLAGIFAGLLAWSAGQQLQVRLRPQARLA
jgi:hypothetical protein